MPGRSQTTNRCDRCQMYRPLCLCAHIAPIQTRSRILVLMHWREKKLPTNTAGLACLALTNSELRMRGAGRPLVSSGEKAGLLYPSEDSIELKQEHGPLTLIVPDGSWRQARKVHHREKSILTLPRYRLPSGKVSTYRLRRAPQPGYLSTFEAIACALGILESEEVEARLDALFLKKVEWTLWSRGVLKPEDAQVEIPHAAFVASWEAGVRGGPKKRKSLVD